MAKDKESGESQDAVSESEKKTNRMFTQSDFDAALAREAKRYEEKYKGYDDLKASVEKLAKEKAEREMADKSEIEKAQLRLAEQAKKIEMLAAENHNFMVERKRDTILSDAKFSALPRAYRNMVKASENDDEVRESADSILKEFEADFGLKKAGAPTPGAATVAINHAANIASTMGMHPKSMADRLKAQLAARMKQGN